MGMTDFAFSLSDEDTLTISPMTVLFFKREKVNAVNATWLLMSSDKKWAPKFSQKGQYQKSWFLRLSLARGPDHWPDPDHDGSGWSTGPTWPQQTMTMLLGAWAFRVHLICQIRKYEKYEYIWIWEHMNMKNVNMRSYEYEKCEYEIIWAWNLIPFMANMIGTGCKSNLIGFVQNWPNYNHQFESIWLIVWGNKIWNCFNHEKTWRFQGSPSHLTYLTGLQTHIHIARQLSASSDLGHSWSRFPRV